MSYSKLSRNMNRILPKGVSRIGLKLSNNRVQNRIGSHKRNNNVKALNEGEKEQLLIQ